MSILEGWWRVVVSGGFFLTLFSFSFFSPRFEGDGGILRLPRPLLSLPRCLITDTSIPLVSFFITITGLLLSDEAERLPEGGRLDTGEPGGH